MAEYQIHIILEKGEDLTIEGSDTETLIAIVDLIEERHGIFGFEVGVRSLFTKPYIFNEVEEYSGHNPCGYLEHLLKQI